jgi:hypothetical protein
MRVAERGLLDLAADHGTAVMVNMPLEKARLHALVGNRPLPDRGQCRQMVRHMETIDGFAGLQSMPWYPGKTFDGQVKLG